MALPLNKRDHDIFLSYAHSDRPFVEKLYRWLQESAGLQAWWDDRDLSAGAMLATDLQRAIERCRAVLLIASDESLARGWVLNEYNAAMDQRANFRGFRMVALRMGGAQVEELMKGISWIDVADGEFTADIALAILRALHPSENQPNPATSRDVYVSASWQAQDNASATAVCRHLVRQGLRLIGDSPDQKGFGAGSRVERIMSSCGAFVAIVPFRGEPLATPGQGPYKYFLQEIEFAASLGLPSVVIADPRVGLADGGDRQWLRLDTASETVPATLQPALNDLWDVWQKPSRPHYVFCAMDLASADTRLTGPVRQLIQLITSMPTVVGDEVHEGNPESVNAAVRHSVCDALLVIADLTDDNLNTCIEAGMALATGTNLELLAAGAPRRPPFMLRERNMPTYADRIEQIGLIHKLSRPYRRRVINAELSP
jgi:hypothetical protein